MEHSAVHAEHVKKNLIRVIETFGKEMERLQALKKTVPVKPCMINGVLENALEPKDSREVVEYFIETSHPVWDRIKSRDKDVILEILPVLIIPKDINPIINGIINLYVDPIIGFLRNRQTFPGDIFEVDVWKHLDMMIENAIAYSHYMRAPHEDGKYKKTFQPDLKVKANAEIWKVHLPWPGRTVVHSFDAVVPVDTNLV
jgi:hypothetical protein